MVKTNTNVNPLRIFDSNFLLSSYADDTTFFLKDLNSAKTIFEIFGSFTNFSGLKVNKSKCQIAGIGVKNGVHVALPGVQSVNLSNESIKILGVHFTYNGEIFFEKNYCEIIKKIEKVLANWRWRNLTLIGKITVFNSLAFSKIIFVSYLTTVPDRIITKLEEIQNDFIWDGKKSLVKYNTMVADYGDGGLKMLHIKAKFKALKLAWVRRLCSDNFSSMDDHPKNLYKN